MNRQEWERECKKALIDIGQTQRTMAKDLGVTYTYIRQVMCGVVTPKDMERKISEYCHVPLYEGRNDE